MKGVPIIPINAMNQQVFKSDLPFCERVNGVMMRKRVNSTTQSGKVTLAFEPMRQIPDPSGFKMSYTWDA